MKPTNHAARLRQMAEKATAEEQGYKRIAASCLSHGVTHGVFESKVHSYAADAAALLAGAEALERLELAVRSLRDLNYFIGVNVHNTISQTLAVVEGRKSDG
jgi:hypothetical protein